MELGGHSHRQKVILGEVTVLLYKVIDKVIYSGSRSMEIHTLSITTIFKVIHFLTYILWRSRNSISVLVNAYVVKEKT